MNYLRSTVLLLTLGVAGSAVSSEPPVSDLRITMLSTNLAGNPGMSGMGEWGFAALVEVGDQRWLFDTGHRAMTVLNNAVELDLPLDEVTDVILSHNHIDHVGGLLELRKAGMKKNPAALGRVHVAEGALWSRLADKDQAEWNDFLSIREDYEELGGEVMVHDGVVELHPGVWLTGPIDRTYEEQSPMRGGKLVRPDGSLGPDDVPEDMAMVFDTVDGLVVLAGCGHAGLINTLEHAQKTVRPEAKVHAVVGGLHLAGISAEKLDWTGEKLVELGLEHLHGGHCTGIAPVYHLREVVGLPRESAIVGAVGATFELGKGITPLWIAR
jgi:7,8-dihydropterin-6-yl-methyl-4-(beta-D-ribofuranosyl)aminobenzene 5'-phosphate synthase